METFDVIANRPDFRIAYQEAIRVSGLDWKVIEAYYDKGRDVKVLDMGGAAEH